MAAKPTTKLKPGTLAILAAAKKRRDSACMKGYSRAYIAGLIRASWKLQPRKYVRNLYKLGGVLR